MTEAAHVNRDRVAPLVPGARSGAAAPSPSQSESVRRWRFGFRWGGIADGQEDVMDMQAAIAEAEGGYLHPAQLPSYRARAGRAYIGVRVRVVSAKV